MSIPDPYHAVGEGGRVEGGRAKIQTRHTYAQREIETERERERETKGHESEGIGSQEDNEHEGQAVKVKERIEAHEKQRLGPRQKNEREEKVRAHVPILDTFIWSVYQPKIIVVCLVWTWRKKSIQQRGTRWRVSILSAHSIRLLTTGY